MAFTVHVLSDRRFFRLHHMTGDRSAALAIGTSADVNDRASRRICEGWQAQIGLDQGLAETYQWYCDNAETFRR